MSDLRYRHDAEAKLKLVEERLAGGSNDLRYAALDLRFAIEDLVYDIALLYRDELPEKALSMWQPRKLLDLLLEFDPNADAGMTFSFGEQSKVGEPAKEMHTLGTERRLKLDEVKDHYDALGSYLHAPNLKALDEQEKRARSLKRRCEKIVGILREVLDSQVWNLNFKQTSELTCLRCGEKTVRRIPLGTKEPIKADCLHCGAPYLLEVLPKNQVRWKSLQENVPCAHCGKNSAFWRDHIHLGAVLRCEHCHERTKMVFGLQKVSADEALTS